jgi:IPT/TIG domain-containing protein/WD40 repeat protein
VPIEDPPTAPRLLHPRSPRPPWRAIVAALAGAVALLPAAGVARAAGFGPFGDPQPVTIAGYPGSAEEPFITPDGNYLLFNSSEEEPDFSLQFATRIDAHSFQAAGPILGAGVNEAGSLSGTPTLDGEGNLYFISNRSYFETLATVYTGHFSAGTVEDVHRVPGVSSGRLGIVDFDVGVSPDGATLYVSAGDFSGGGTPTAASIELYERDAGGFQPDRASAKILRAVNQVGALNYAADPSADGLELFFTSASPALGRAPSIYRAVRSSLRKPFAGIEKIAAISGFAEAPSISSDGTTLYYHELLGDAVEVESVSRMAGEPAISGIAPKSGPSAGGTAVTITGTNLTGASAVHFATSEAESFTVNSPTSITALSPPGARGAVDVTVTTPAGTNAPVSKDRFKYRR